MMNHPFYKTMVLLLFCLLTFPLFLPAQQGALDSCFGDNGISTTSFGNINFNPIGIAIQGDNKIIVGGEDHWGNTGVMRYNNYGELDYTFGKAGFAKATFDNLKVWGTSIAVQDDGKIVLAGFHRLQTPTVPYRMALTRFNFDGSIDISFGDNGIVFTSIDTFGDYPTSVILQPNGKIVVGGQSYDSHDHSNFVVVRYNSNGSVDTTFDSDGIAITSFSSEDNRIASIVLQPDGKILAVGTDGIDFALCRYNINGTLDTTFGINGRTITHIDTASAFPTSVVLQPNGKIVVLGAAWFDVFSYSKFVLARYNYNGSLDTEFNNDGINITTIGGKTENYVDRVLILQNERILTTGYNYDCGCIILAQYNEDGSLDIGFDNDGILIFPPLNHFSSMFVSSTLQKNNKLVLAGHHSNNIQDTVILVRYILPPYNGVNDCTTSEISIYPNPFSNSMTIDLGTFRKNLSFIIYNMYGQKVDQLTNLSGRTITYFRNNLPSGFYALRIIDDGKVLRTAKIAIID